MILLEKTHNTQKLNKCKKCSGSIVTNEGKPRCAFTSKLDLVVANLRCTTPGINHCIGKKELTFHIDLTKLAIGILLLCGSVLANPHLLVVCTVSTP